MHLYCGRKGMYGCFITCLLLTLCVNCQAGWEKLPLRKSLFCEYVADA